MILSFAILALCLLILKVNLLAGIICGVIFFWRGFRIF